MPLVTASIPSPSSGGFQLGPFEVHAYGLMYLLALAAAVLITVRRWEAQGGSRATVYEVALWGFPAGLIGGRLYFDLTSSGEVPAHWWGPFAIWDGGLGIWGGIALGTAVGVWRLRRAGVSVAQFVDAAAPALLVAQAIGRIGNYFNQELFGGPSSLPWALEISPAHRPAGYEGFATFQPTFLYELIWNLSLAAFLVWLGNHRRIRPPGLFALYVTGYSAFRILEESLRVDPAHHILGLRLNFFVASLLTLGGAVWFARTQGWRPRLGSGRGAALLLAGGVLALSACAGGCSDSARAAGVVPREGSWAGETTAGLPVDFGVLGGRVLNPRFKFSWGFCGTYELHAARASLEIDAGDHWALQDPRGQTLEGTFVAPDRLEGKVISLERELPGCPRTEATFTAVPVPPNPESLPAARAGIEALPYEIHLREARGVKNTLIGKVLGSRGESFRFFLFVNRDAAAHLRHVPGYGFHGKRHRIPNRGLEGGALANTDVIFSTAPRRGSTKAQEDEQYTILAAVEETVCRRQTGEPCPAP
jgi:prolipoprotein diacylglyceryl transferase